MTTEQAVTQSLHSLRLEQRFHESIETIGTGRKWRTPMKLLTDERTSNVPA